MTLKTEIPETEFALRQYILYSQKQIKESKSLVTKLNNRIKACVEKCQQRGFNISDILETKGE